MAHKSAIHSSLTETLHPPVGDTKSPSVHASQHLANPLLSAQQSIGNQALLQLFSAGKIQAKLRVSQPGDPDEQEADRVADRVVASTHAPKIHRKCACESSGTPCAKCEEDTIHRSAATLALSSSPVSIQRAPAASDPVNAPDKAADTPAKPSPTPSKTHPLIVEDDAASVAPHQMRKSAFIGLLRTEACTAADSILKSVGRSTESCPYIARWLAFYEKQSSEHVERAVLKYVPETARAHNAHQAINLVIARVRHATLTWARTGKVSGLPDDLAAQNPGQGVFGAVQKFASTGVGGAILGFIGGRKPEKSPDEKSQDHKHAAPSISRKATSDSGPSPTHDAGAVRSHLGSGHALDSRVQSQMSSAFGHDFSSVRVHTDSSAEKLSSDLQARAFTIGSDVAFASGEYKPGTLIGDALIAHELAHVVQQSGGETVPTPQRRAEGDDSFLEQDADRSAVRALTSAWRTQTRLVGQGPASNLKSGLRLSRCKDEKERLKVCIRPVQIADDDGKNATALPSFGATKNIWAKCCIDIDVHGATKVSKTAYKTLDESPNDVPTAEESALFAAAGGGGGCVSVFVADKFKQGADEGKDISGGGGTYDGGAADAKVVVVEGIQPTIVAHEMGHAMGHGPHEPPGTVMVATDRHDKPASTKVAGALCDDVRKFVGATPTGKKDCSTDI